MVLHRPVELARLIGFLARGVDSHIPVSISKTYPGLGLDKLAPGLA
jgi:hypothetical protein